MRGHETEIICFRCRFIFMNTNANLLNIWRPEIYMSEKESTPFSYMVLHIRTYLTLIDSSPILRVDKPDPR